MDTREYAHHGMSILACAYEGNRPQIAFQKAKKSR